jgi:hypothetical protein
MTNSIFAMGEFNQLPESIPKMKFFRILFLYFFKFFLGETTNDYQSKSLKSLQHPILYHFQGTLV